MCSSDLVCNVYSLHEVFTADRRDWIAEQCRSAGIGCVDCKSILADSINEYFREFRERHAEFSASPERVKAILRDTSDCAMASTA